MADRGFCSYAHLALLFQRGVHGLLRLHQRMIVDFTPARPHATPGEKNPEKGLPRSKWMKQWGASDQVVRWLKPRQKPTWMTAAQYASLPSEIELRELRYQITKPGFRTQQITLVTTLLDAERYPLAELASQYAQRWEIETNIGHLKTTMNMDVLKCKTVAGVLRELYVFALVYNLVRQVMLEAAQTIAGDSHPNGHRRMGVPCGVSWL